MKNDPINQQVYWHTTLGVMVPLDAEHWVAMTVVDGQVQIVQLDGLPAGVSYRAIGWAADFGCRPDQVPVSPA